MTVDLQEALIAQKIDREQPGKIGNIVFHQEKETLEHGQKLYTAKDLEKLIEDRLENHRKRVEDNNALDKLNLNDAKARVNELENLLEEVQENE